MPTHNPVTFFKRFMASPVAVGAFLPTSLATARIMASPIPKGGTVLELGAGTGSITQGILERIGDPARLTSIEIDAELANEFKKNFPLVNLTVTDAENILKRVASYDAIVSGVPFTVMSPAKRARMFDLITKRMKPDGVFIAIQYSLSSLHELKEYFDRVRIRFSPLNVPPAVVYVCTGAKQVEKRFS
jgi:phospholipid N-methyltransferase